MTNKSYTYEIHSRESLENKARQPFKPHTTLISVRDPDAMPPRLVYKPAHMLRLIFDDMTAKEALERLELPEELLKRKRALYRVMLQNGIVLFNGEMAEQCAAFVLEHAQHTRHFICQCEFGQSRSAAVSAALAEFFEGSEKSRLVFSDDRYSPNPRVYKKLLKALENYKEVLSNE